MREDILRLIDDGDDLELAYLLADLLGKDRFILEVVKYLGTDECMEMLEDIANSYDFI